MGGRGSARGWGVGTPSHFRMVEGEREGVGHGHPLALWTEPWIIGEHLGASGNFGELPGSFRELPGSLRELPGRWVEREREGMGRGRPLALSKALPRTLCLGIKQDPLRGSDVSSIFWSVCGGVPFKALGKPEKPNRTFEGGRGSARGWGVGTPSHPLL